MEGFLLPLPPIARMPKERTILVNGVSKTYAMTGWRIGYLACTEPLAKAIGNWQSHATSNPNSIAQAAAPAASPALRTASKRW